MGRKKAISAADAQKLMLNQVRHRILQYIHHHGNVTVREIGSALSDIPQATLYRQIKLLLDGGLIRVCGQRQVRGTLEHTYGLASELEEVVGSDESKLSDVGAQFALLGIAQDFADYYADEDADAVRDLYSIQSVPMMMSDEEFAGYIRQIEKLTRSYIHNEPTSERRIRRVTLISSPA